MKPRLVSGLIRCALLLGMVTVLARAQDITSGLAAWYRFDGTLVDSSGARLDLSAGGTFSFVSDHNGAANSAVQLTTAAANGTFFLGTGPSLAGSSSSVSFWVRKDYSGDGNNGSWVFGLGHPAGVGGSTGQDMHVALDYGSSIRYAFFYDDFNLSTAVSSYAWHNLAFTFDASTMTKSAYLDGTLIGSATAAFGFSGGDSLKVGYAGLSLDDLRFYDRALSAADVATLAAVPEPASYAVWAALAAILTAAGLRRLSQGRSVRSMDRSGQVWGSSLLVLWAPRRGGCICVEVSHDAAQPRSLSDLHPGSPATGPWCLRNMDR